MSSSTPYTTGHELKSILINIATILLFILPVASYIYIDHAKEMIAGVAGSFILAFIAPPMGWMRPHPYSDMPGNRPKQS
eukprot:CAMPEP_0172475242 /NCGR_PEP_ID=MMETSP1065-20121228/69768_1 /TAXON_ID=265537 /ORGANISM="Amphiprora paludosa, Strain CCMP125" /LENGTH=78 /DNA_ID=CAMNT_0013233439 /DNA_START=88 /DNA_END=324 /DNA_ORIENTATION=+